ncbi:MAG: hypothetical protein IKW66_06585, partial [Clostridia bacterium]|nr:hypothetical protein [Clostridia bacterium]
MPHPFGEIRKNSLSEERGSYGCFLSRGFFAEAKKSRKKKQSISNNHHPIKKYPNNIKKKGALK